MGEEYSSNPVQSSTVSWGIRERGVAGARGRRSDIKQCRGSHQLMFSDEATIDSICVSFPGRIWIMF